MIKRQRRIQAALSVSFLALGSLAIGVPAHATTTSVSNWNDLLSAFSSASGSNNLITLARGFTSPSGNTNILQVPGSTSITLDLNGQTLIVDFSGSNSGAGIEVPSTASLTIDATGGGTLTAKGGPGAYTNPGSPYYGAGAGIGGSGGGFNNPAYVDGDSCGTVTINGGTITATGGSGGTSPSFGTGAPGIGGGSGNYQHNSGSPCALTINGGTVNAIGGAAGPSGAGGAAIGTAGVISSLTPPAGGTFTVAGTTTSSLVPAGLGYSAGVGFTGGQASTITLSGSGSTFTYAVTTATSISTQSTATITYTAYGVTINNANGAGGTSVQTVPIGSSPTPPTVAGYTFAGWRLGSASGAVFPNNAPVTAPMTLYAIWTPNSGSSSSGSSSSTLATSGTNSALPLGLAALALLGGGTAIMLNRRRSQHG